MRRLAGWYAINAVTATVWAVWRGEPAAFLGLRTGRSALFDGAVGVGTGMSAPWPMVLILMVGAGREDPLSRKVVGALCLLFIGGVLGEPCTWRPRTPHALDRLILAANLVLPALMLVKLRNVLGTVTA